MMAKQQYLSDDDQSWHPHLMFFVSGNAAKSWGANLPGSPVIAGDDPEERVTVFMMVARHLGPMGRRDHPPSTDEQSTHFPFAEPVAQDGRDPDSRHQQ